MQSSQRVDFPIRVAVVDDHPMVRNGLRYFLFGFDDMELVGEAASGEEAIELAANKCPDVILMDLLMPGMGGVEATRIIRKQFPNIHVIALTSFHDEELVHAALGAGAVSYLLKNISADSLAQAVRAAKLGRRTLASEAAEALVHVIGRADAVGCDLSDREREVLRLMVRGCTNAQIGAELSITSNTVKNHITSILSKLGVISRGEAAFVAMENHLVD